MRDHSSRRRAPLWLRMLVACLAVALPLGAQAGGATAASVAPRRVPVIWLIGQSNAEGATAGYWLANPLGQGAPYVRLSSQPAARVWWPGPSLQRPAAARGWEPYRVGSVQPENNGSFWIVEGTFGPEAPIADAAVARFGEVFVFKFTWVAVLDPRATLSFSRNPAAPQSGIYGAMMQLWQLAVADLAARNLAPRIEGIVWVQGEGDCFATGTTDQLAFARVYEPNLTRFIADLRADLGEPGRTPLPFVISQLHDRHLPRGSWAVAEGLVRTAQANVAAADPNVALTATDAFTLYPADGQVHFDALGSVQLGYALWQSLASMLPP